MEYPPSTFVEWREIYRTERVILGMMVACRFDGLRIHMDRHLWKQLHRFRRIEQRMEVERQVKDATWCREFLSFLKSESE